MSFHSENAIEESGRVNVTIVMHDEMLRRGSA